MLRIAEPMVITNISEHLGRVSLALNWQEGRIRFVSNTDTV